MENEGQEKKEGKTYYLPKNGIAALGDHESLMYPHFKDGKLFLTNGHILLIFPGYDEVPDGPMSVSAAEFLTENHLPFSADEKKIYVSDLNEFKAEFDRPEGINPPNFDRPLSDIEQEGQRIRISFNAEALMEAIKASRNMDGHGIVNMDIPISYLFSGISGPWNVAYAYSKAEKFLFMPCRIEFNDMKENSEALRNYFNQQAGEKEEGAKS